MKQVVEPRAANDNPFDDVFGQKHKAVSNKSPKEPNPFTQTLNPKP